MADFIYTIKVGGVTHPEYSTLAAAVSDFKAQNRMGAGISIVAANSTLYFRFQGFLTGLIGPNLAGIDTTAANAFVVIEGSTGKWNASTANALGNSTGFDGFSLSGGETVFAGSNNTTIQDIIIAGSTNPVAFQQGGTGWVQLATRCILVATGGSTAVGASLQGTSKLQNSLVILTGASAASTKALDIYGRYGAQPSVENCTLVALGTGTGSIVFGDINGSGGSPLVKNTYMGGFASWGALPILAGSTGNSGPDTSTPGTSPLNSIALSTANFLSVTGNGDLRPVASSALKTTGAARLASVLNDAYNQARGTTATIGAAEPLVAVSALSGNVTLDDAVAAGAFSSIASSLSGNVTLDDAVAAGAFGVAPGILTITGIKNNTGTLLAGVTLPNVVVIRRSDLAALLALKAQVINGAGALVLPSTALIPGTACQVFAFENDGSLGGCWPATVI